MELSQESPLNVLESDVQKGVGTLVCIICQLTLSVYYINDALYMSCV